MYSLFLPAQAVGANLVYFDLFVPAGSPLDVVVQAVNPVVSGSAAVTGVLGVDLFLTRTTAVGTGGTAATAEGTALTAATFSHHGGNAPLKLGQISARLTPTGGATAGAVLGLTSVFTEETSPAPYTPPQRWVPDSGIVVPSGTGIRVVQGAVASVGNIGFTVWFKVRER